MEDREKLPFPEAGEKEISENELRGKVQNLLVGQILKSEKEKRILKRQRDEVEEILYGVVVEGKSFCEEYCPLGRVEGKGCEQLCHNGFLSLIREIEE